MRQIWLGLDRRLYDQRSGEFFQACKIVQAANSHRAWNGKFQLLCKFLKTVLVYQSREATVARQPKTKTALEISAEFRHRKRRIIAAQEKHRPLAQCTLQIEQLPDQRRTAQRRYNELAGVPGVQRRRESRAVNRNHR